LTLTPTAEVTPLNPVSSLIDDPVAGTWKYYLVLKSFNAFINAWGVETLKAQYDQNKTVFYVNPIPSPAPSSMPFPYFKHSVAHLQFRSNATTENQYLLIYHVIGSWGYPRAAFYINGNLVRSEEVKGDEYIAILCDCPPSQTWWHAYMYHEDKGMLWLKGVQLFIL